MAYLAIAGRGAYMSPVTFSHADADPPCKRRVMSRHIKRAALAGQQEEADAKIRSTVEAIIADVAERGDGAVCELSERFDKWSPASFRLGDAAIRDLVAKVALQTIDDIKFAQAQAPPFRGGIAWNLKDVGVNPLSVAVREPPTMASLGAE